MSRTVQEEPEEGEIIDDLEMISDSSIPSSPVSGKSVPHRDLLRDVSLSSISDSGSGEYRVPASHPSGRHRHKRKRRSPPYRKRRKSCRYDSDSSESDIDNNLQKQLKRAVRVDNSSLEVNRNSLQDRLKTMLGKTEENRQDDDEDLDTLREIALLSSSKEKNNKDSDGTNENVQNEIEEDKELVQLRLDALKSAMLKKALERKKRKENKENDVNKDNKDVGSNEEIKETEKNVKKEDVPSENVNNSIEEDVDIMRAMLLVSMSNKVIPKDTKTSTPVASAPKKILLKPIIKPVKRLIINLNDSDESDSEELKEMKIAESKTNKLESKIPPKTDKTTFKIVKTEYKTNKIESRIDKIESKIDQKESATNKTELKLDKTELNIDKTESKVDKADLKRDKIEEFLRIQRAAVEEQRKLQQNENERNDLLLDKSVVKLLPKSQQREYQILKQKLLMARRKKLRKTSTKLVNKVSNAVSNPVKNSGQKQENRMILQRTLEDMQVKKSGRLQMKGKYKALAPLLQKVNSASIERKQCELTIKKLLADLQKARDKLHVLHQNYSNLVLKLTRAKNAIDRGTAKSDVGTTTTATTTALKNSKPSNATFKLLDEKKTSTPLKETVEMQISCNISSIRRNSSLSVPAASDAIIEDKKGEEVKKCEEIKKYVSPLDARSSEQVNDPLTMYCPFELFGVCKDPECHFNHCPK